MVFLALLGFVLLPQLDFPWSGTKKKTPREDRDAPRPTGGTPMLEEPAEEPKTVDAGKGIAWLTKLAALLQDYERQLKGRDAIQGEVVLQFKDQAGYERFLKEAAASGLKIKGTLPGLRAVRASYEAPDALDKYLARHPNDQTTLGANYTVEVPEVPPEAERNSGSETPFNGSALAFMGVKDNANWGQGVTVAILDSGIGANGAFGDRVRSVSLAENGTTDLSHGTSVASLAAGVGVGVSPGASILSVGVVSADGMSDTFTLANGIITAVDQGASVINISLGSYGDSAVMRQAVAYAAEHGAVIVASDGNDGLADATYPARYEGVIGVGAVDANGSIVSFSNASQNFGITAPGLEVMAALPDNQQGLFSGTSAAAPYITGSIAGIMTDNPGMNATQAAQLLLTYADEAGAPGPDADYGYGVVNLSRVQNRNTPGITDAAVASHFFDAKADGGPVVQYVVENRGTTALLNWQYQTNTNGLVQQWTLPIVQANEEAVIRVPVNPSQTGSSGLHEFESRLIRPAGVTDANPSNNGRGSVVQPVSAAGP